MKKFSKSQPSKGVESVEELKLERYISREPGRRTTTQNYIIYSRYHNSKELAIVVDKSTSLEFSFCVVFY